jgi:hypothetical protein
MSAAAPNPFAGEDEAPG